jgi:predicted O-methyltransferase YrrM
MATTDSALAFVESLPVEDSILLAARARAQEVGVVPVSPAGGAVLHLLAGATRARSAVEVGTGTGVSGLWLLRGMRPDGVLTSIDAEAEHQRLARTAFTEDGVPTARARLITGRALDVLPRLADASYDLVVCSADKREYPDYLGQVVRLLRPGGVLVFDGVLRAAEQVARDAEAGAARRLIELIGEEPRLATAVLPVDTGLLAAVLVAEGQG